jgi:hypothetical protein
MFFIDKKTFLGEKYLFGCQTGTNLIVTTINN